MISQKWRKISCIYSLKSLLPIDFFDFYNRRLKKYLWGFFMKKKIVKLLK